jgi:uncharacterized protein (DUF1015 family)
MAVVRPFRALRPEPHAAAAVAAVPYDVVSTDEARALAAGEPLSFLHVTRPEIDLAPGVDVYDASVYDTARVNLARLSDTAPLVVEARPALYVYRLRDGDHTQVGVAGCFSLDEYDDGTIKKHERTRPDKEDDRTRHMVTIEAQTGVVFLTYRQTTDIDTAVDQVCDGEALFDFVAPDGIRHTVWRATAGQTAGLVERFGPVPALYIADGHHRAASAARARRTLATAAGGSQDGDHERDYVLAVAFPDHQTRILPYNRTVSDLAGATPEAFLERVSARLAVEPTSVTTPIKGDASMYLNGRWYRLALADGAPAAGTDPVGRLDVSVLQDQILGPVLDVRDIRTDPRVRFVGGIRGTSELEQLVDLGVAAVAFSMAAVSVEELLAIADAGAIMAPKSTWFEPKLRDGLLTHPI